MLTMTLSILEISKQMLMDMENNFEIDNACLLMKPSKKWKSNFMM